MCNLVDEGNWEDQRTDGRIIIQTNSMMITTIIFVPYAPSQQLQGQLEKQCSAVQLTITLQRKETHKGQFRKYHNGNTMSTLHNKETHNGNKEQEKQCP
jgi:hypothetical protein